jgi:hypothetical protein
LASPASAWTSRADAQDGSSSGVFGQRYANSGSPLGAELRVNTYMTGTQSTQFSRSVASASDGNFVVVWGSYLQDGSASDLFGQLYGQITPVQLQRLSVE